MTLGQTRREKTINALLTLARRYGDERWMTAAILSSSNNHAGEMLIELLSYAEGDAKSRRLLQPLAATVSGRREGSAMSLVLATIVGMDESIGQPCLAGFVDGMSRGVEPVPASSDGWACVTALLRSESRQIRDLATELASKLSLADNNQLKIIFAKAVTQALNDEVGVDQRRHAIQILASSSFDTLAPVAVKFLDAKQPPLL